MPSYRIILALPARQSAVDLTALLVRAGHATRSLAAGADLVEFAERHPSEAILLSPEWLSRARTLRDEGPAAPILVMGEGEVAEPAEIVDSGVLAVIALPGDPAVLLPSIDVAVAVMRAEKTLKSDLETARKKLESRAVTDCAKGVLMQAHRVSEVEAFRRIQTQSMNTRRSIREVSEEILRLYLGAP